MLSLERCAAILRNNDCRMDNGTLKELRDYLYSIAFLQVMNEDSEPDINGFIGNKSDN